MKHRWIALMTLPLFFSISCGNKRSLSLDKPSSDTSNGIFGPTSDSNLSDTPTADLTPVENKLLSQNWDNGDGVINQSDIPSMREKLFDWAQAASNGQVGNSEKKDNGALMSLLSGLLNKRPQSNGAEDLKQYAQQMHQALMALIQCFLGYLTAQQEHKNSGGDDEEDKPKKDPSTTQLASCVSQATAAAAPYTPSRPQ